LEDVSVGNRRPPGGESLVIRGRTGPPTPAGTASGSVWIEAAFFALDSEARGAITITVYPDRVLATIRGIRFFATSEPQVLPGDGPLIALVSGYQSWSTCRVTPLPADVTSFGAIGLTRAGHGIAAMWDPGDAGEGKVTLAPDGSLDAVSEWQPARPVRSDGDGATLRIAYLSAGDGLDALSAAATPASSVDRERVAALTVPTGWCSWYELGADVTEADMLANIEFCGANRRACGSLPLPSPSNLTSRERIHPGFSRAPFRRPRGLPSSWTLASHGAAGFSPSTGRTPAHSDGCPISRAAWCANGATTI